MININIIGYIGIVFTLLSFIPVILNIAKTKKTNNFPYKTIILAYIGKILLLLNGILANNHVLTFMGGLLFIIYSYILYIKLNY